MKIAKFSAMQEAFESHPSAQRTLLHRSDISGYHWYEYQPEALFEKKAHCHSMKDSDEVIEPIKRIEQDNQYAQVSSSEVAATLASKDHFHLSYIRTREDCELTSFENSKAILCSLTLAPEVVNCLNQKIA